MKKYSYRSLSKLALKANKSIKGYYVFVKLKTYRKPIGMITWVEDTAEWKATHVEDRREKKYFKTRDAAAKWLEGARKRKLRRKARAEKMKTCRCRDPKSHSDCFYCGTGFGDSVCGVCAEGGIDGRIIRGTSRTICSTCKTSRPKKRAILKRYEEEIRAAIGDVHTLKNIGDGEPLHMATCSSLQLKCEVCDLEVRLWTSGDWRKDGRKAFQVFGKGGQVAYGLQNARRVFGNPGYVLEY